MGAKTCGHVCCDASACTVPDGSSCMQ
jgi:hypothetical protein